MQNQTQQILTKREVKLLGYPLLVLPDIAVHLSKSKKFKTQLVYQRDIYVSAEISVSQNLFVRNLF